MENGRREVWNIDTLLKQSKNTSYRETVYRRQGIVFKFLKDNGLINIEPFDANGIVKSDLVVHADDLTWEGLKLLSWEDSAPEFKMPPVLKWHAYLDKGGAEDNISHLIKGLELLRKKT